eukprot:sb/3462202/
MPLISLLLFQSILSTLIWISGASGCRELKKEYPSYRIRLRPLRDSNGTCAIDKSCCNEDVERVVREESLVKMKRVVQREVDSARSSVQFIKSQAEGNTKRMMKELFPADMAAHINVDQVADIVWRYSVGEITAVDLLIEGAIAAMFTEQAEESVRATAECVMSELTKTAPDAFGQITGIVDDVLKAPRTFGRGLQVAESLLLAVENTELSSVCNYDELFGCQKCGVKLPNPCRASCVSSARSCLAEINAITPLWMVWVDSIASLTDALVLMKDIPIDPESIVDEDTIATITRDIMGSMGNANYQKCLASKRLKRRATRSHKEEEPGYYIPGRRVRRDFSEGDMLKLSLEGNFVEYDMERGMCRDATSDSQCWLGDRVGDVDDAMLTKLQESERITKAYTRAGTDMVSGVIHGYAATVNIVIAEIHQKDRNGAVYPLGSITGSDRIFGSVRFGASGCRELKKEYPSYRIRLRPLRDSNGTCAIDKSCCNEDVERVVREESLVKMKRVVQREVDSARSSVQFIKSQAEGNTKRMMKELFPADMAAHINVDQVADIVWRYSVGEITAVDLLIEGAIAAMFTEQAEESVRATAECVMSELTKTAPDAFGQITGIVDDVLKAPRTFGRGLQVAESLLLAVENTELSSVCNYDDLFGCQKCGIKLPNPCRASCVSSARSCLAEINAITPLWMVWVDSIASLTDALVLMKDIPIDPESIVDEDTIATITRDIMGSMGNANYQKCLASKRLKRRATRSHKEEEPGYYIPGRRVRRDFSEGDMLKLSLEGNFVEYDMERGMCRDATSDSQ